MPAELRRVTVQSEPHEVTLSVTGEGAGPAVVLLHGFPEIGYSWRHQVSALAAAGYRVIAPDQRGYGWSDTPDGVDAYSMFDLVGDVIGLLDAEEIDEAVIVGHDWGALIAPWVALFRPDRVRGVALLSVPYQPRLERSPIDHIQDTDPEGRFDYILAFQHEGIEAFMDADPIAVLRSAYWIASGAIPEGHTRGDPPPDGLPPHLSAAEFENYCRAFARTGFGPAVNYYRNLHSNWERTRAWHGAPLTVPTIFIGGAKDFVIGDADGGLGSTLASMEVHCLDHRATVIIDGAGHWVQQEAPDAVNEALIGFLSDL